MSHQHPAFLLPDDREFRLSGVGDVAPLAILNPDLGQTTIGVDATADDDDQATVLLLRRTQPPTGIP